MDILIRGLKYQLLQLILKTEKEKSEKEDFKARKHPAMVRNHISRVAYLSSGGERILATVNSHTAKKKINHKRIYFSSLKNFEFKFQAYLNRLYFVCIVLYKISFFFLFSVQQLLIDSVESICGLGKRKPP